MADQEEFREKVKEIHDKVSTGLYIARVPQKTKLAFMTWAKEDFCGDYGLSLKHLWDFREGLIASPNEQLQLQIQALQIQIDEIKGVVATPQPEQKEEKVIRALNGRIISKKRGE